ncbi:MAG: hypothetical protein NTV23_04150 [Propionibacteriales bacterium]|nr:hypothetical protein [Propionibacteriales bacterium]
MRLFRRGEQAPAVIVEAAGLQPREKVLAFAQATSAAGSPCWLLGSRFALYLVTPGEAGVRLGWESIQAADWDQEAESLTVSEVGEFGAARAGYVVSMEAPVLLLQLIRERVTASVVLQRGYLMDGKTGFKVIGRRAPSGGPIAWMHEYDVGIDPEAPEVRAAAAEALVRARADVGE